MYVYRALELCYFCLWRCHVYSQYYTIYWCIIYHCMSCEHLYETDQIMNYHPPIAESDNNETCIEMIIPSVVSATSPRWPVLWWISWCIHSSSFSLIFFSPHSKCSWQQAARQEHELHQNHHWPVSAFSSLSWRISSFSRLMLKFYHLMNHLTGLLSRSLHTDAK